MNYNFTYQGKAHILNTTTGELVGAFAEPLRAIVDYNTGEISGGHPSSPFAVVLIERPYQDIVQFSMSLVEALEEDFPKELEPYVKYHKEVQPDYSGLDEEEIKAMQQFDQYTYY